MKIKLGAIFLGFSLLNYWGFILVGILIAGSILVKVLGYYDFSSDWLWFLAGVGLMIEGGISLIKQKQFSRKYKIVERGREYLF